MEIDVIILKPAELVLKSKGIRKDFENRLLFNVKDCLKKNDIDFDHVVKGQGRYFVYTPEINEALLSLKNVFGISNLCASVEVGAEINAIKSAVLDFADEFEIGAKHSFGIRANTSSTNFEMSSKEIETSVGATVQQKTKARVNLRKPDFWIRIDVVGRRAFIYSDVFEGLGGLPLGTGGNVLVMMSEKQEDVLAAFLMMKRGCEIFPVHIRKEDKKLALFQKNCDILNHFAWGSRIKPISIKDSRKELPDIIKKTGAKAYVFGNTNFHARDADLPVFEPLIGLEKKELKALKELVFNGPVA